MSSSNTDPGPGRRVLVVAGWYPAHDDPGRGSFVADQAATLREAGFEVVVASWESAYVRGKDSERGETARTAVAAWRRAVASEEALSRPRSWGAREVPVARLPALLTPGSPTTQELVSGHDALLLPFGSWLHRRWPIDVIHAHVGLPYALAAARLATRLSVPLVTTEHDSSAPAKLNDKQTARLYRELARRGRQLLAVSPALADRLARRLGMPTGAVQVVANPVPLDAFQLGLAEGRDNDELLWVGARKESKGTERLLQAFALARRSHPELHLRLIGTAPSAAVDENYRKVAKLLGISDAVKFDPPAARGDVAEAMRSAGVFVHPSGWETFGMVAAEALACGLPIAATPSGGVEAIVGTDGRFGEVAADQTPEALASAILRLRGRLDDMDRTEMRRSVETRFAPHVVARRLSEVYASARAAGRPPLRAELALPPSVPSGASWKQPIVISLNPTMSRRRLASVPRQLASKLIVITTPALKGHPVPAVPGWIDVRVVSPADEFRARRDALAQPPIRGVPPRIGRRLAAFRSPGKWLARRRLSSKGTRRRIVGELVRIALASAGTIDSWILALDAEDVPIATSIPGAAGRVAPGGLRWLADRSDALQPAAKTSPESAVEVASEMS